MCLLWTDKRSKQDSKQKDQFMENSLSEEEKSTCKDRILACYKRFTAENVIVFSQHQ